MNLIDTHIWIWLIGAPDKLSSAATKALAQDPNIGISVLSCWEISLLCHKSRLNLGISTQEWIERTRSQLSVQFIPLSVVAATMAGGTEAMDWDHPDPADRLIVATARTLNLDLITADRTIHSYPGIHTIW